MHSSTLSVLFAAVVPALIGCGSSSNTAATSTSTSASSSSTGSGGASCTAMGGVDAPDISGHFAYRDEYTLDVMVPGSAEPQQTHVINILLVDQTLAASAVTFNGTYCQHTIDDKTLPVHVTIPDAYVKALPPVKRTGTYQKTGANYAYHMPKLVEVEGAKLANPDTDKLPTDATDPVVFDQDGDGKPGMTLVVTGLVDGQLYVAERGSTELDGAPLSKDALEGTMKITSEQNVLDSDPMSLKMLASAGVPNTGMCAHTFKMVRIPDGSDCAYIIKNLSTLFP